MSVNMVSGKGAASIHLKRPHNNVEIIHSKVSGLLNFVQKGKRHAKLEEMVGSENVHSPSCDENIGEIVKGMFERRPEFLGIFAGDGLTTKVLTHFFKTKNELESDYNPTFIFSPCGSGNAVSFETGFKSLSIFKALYNWLYSLYTGYNHHDIAPLEEILPSGTNRGVSFHTKEIGIMKIEYLLEGKVIDTDFSYNFGTGHDAAVLNKYNRLKNWLKIDGFKIGNLEVEPSQFRGFKAYLVATLSHLPRFHNKRYVVEIDVYGKTKYLGPCTLTTAATVRTIGFGLHVNPLATSEKIHVRMLNTGFFRTLYMLPSAFFGSYFNQKPYIKERYEKASFIGKLKMLPQKIMNFFLGPSVNTELEEYPWIYDILTENATLKTNGPAQCAGEERPRYDSKRNLLYDSIRITLGEKVNVVCTRDI